MKKILFFLFVLIFLLSGGQNADAVHPYCVCDYKVEITGICTPFSNKKIGHKAPIDYKEECAATTKDSDSLKNILVGGVCEVSSCEMKICDFEEDNVYENMADDGVVPGFSNPFQSGVEVNWNKNSCITYDEFEAYEKKNECAKLVEFLDCDEELPVADGIDPNTSVCLPDCIEDPKCEWKTEGKVCVVKSEEKIVCANLIAGKDCVKDKVVCTNACNGVAHCEFSSAGKCVNKTSATTDGPLSTDAIKGYYEGYYGVPEGYRERGGALPDCAFSGTCRNVNDLLQLIINFGSGMFVIIGSFAFAFFVFGGFTIVTSFGNAERVKKGRDIMVAAVVGMVIALSAYLLIDFMLDALDVAPEFRGIK